MIRIRCINCEDVFQVEDTVEQAVCPICGKNQELDINQIVGEETQQETVAPVKVVTSVPEKAPVKVVLSVPEKALVKAVAPVPEKVPTKAKAISKTDMLSEADQALANGNYQKANTYYCQILQMTGIFEAPDYRALWGKALCSAYERKQMMSLASCDDEILFGDQYGIFDVNEDFKKAMEQAPEEAREAFQKKYEELQEEYKKSYNQKLHDAGNKKIRDQIERLMASNTGSYEKVCRLLEIGRAEPQFEEDCREKAEAVRTQYRENLRVAELQTMEEVQKAQKLLEGDEKIQAALKLQAQMLRERAAAKRLNKYRILCDNMNDPDWFESKNDPDGKGMFADDEQDELAFWNHCMVEMAQTLKEYLLFPNKSLLTSFTVFMKERGLTDKYMVSCMEKEQKAGNIAQEEQILIDYAERKGKTVRSTAPAHSPTERELEYEFAAQAWRKPLMFAMVKYVAIYAAVLFCGKIIGSFLGLFSESLALGLIGIRTRVLSLVILCFLVIHFRQLLFVFISKKNYIRFREIEEKIKEVIQQRAKKQSKGLKFYTEDNGRIHVKMVE